MNPSRRSFILDALAYRVRMFSRRQLLSLGPSSKAHQRNFRRFRKSLLDSRLVREIRVLVRPEPVVDQPLARWQPDEPPPPFQEIQYLAEKRNAGPVMTTTVYVGTDRLANILGGTCGGSLNHHSVSHDLGVSQVYLHLWKRDPGLALAWQGEDIVAPSRLGQKLPDALLFDSDGEPAMAVEFIGDYPVERIKAFHDDCKIRNLPYEMY